MFKTITWEECEWDEAAFVRSNLTDNEWLRRAVEQGLSELSRGEVTAASETIRKIRRAGKREKRGGRNKS